MRVNDLPFPPPPHSLFFPPSLQVILRLTHNAGALREKVTSSVQELADRGFRALGVAISYTGA